ncbi:AAA family ATPase [Sphingobacterium faecale]|uniref:ATP-dependent Clp protease ATP-binding subunit n=1 Tax=Sphingobacterium faecale TaxID=2803775 RepID=A0ABS1RA44_9SPHI|nr:AAA family ATPase [Sphingobacterium faecale]MBL1411548.1 ATP-dependent Clp protease ATP-binding subunit [Sphingobacterium faecale]
MGKQIVLYKKRDFYRFKEEKESEGTSIVSLTRFIYNIDKIECYLPIDAIDISSLSGFPDKQSIAENVLDRFDDDNSFVCEEEKWSSMSYDLRYVFTEPVESFSEYLDYEEDDEKPNIPSGNNRTLTFYSNNEYSSLEALLHKKNFTIESISKYISQNELIELLEADSMIIDISCLTGYSSIQSVAEKVIYEFPNQVVYICDESRKAKLQYELRFLFNKFQGIHESHLIDSSDVLLSNEKLVEAKKHKLITDLPHDELKSFFTAFRERLYGHPKFKDDFEDLVNTFRVFNKIREHKILSLFLMGDSGVGKTEVARAIFNCLGGTKRLAKINFGNYSNEFSLSSLIGSARGYIGSDDGEIFMKVRDTDIGILLIDEFEKSNAALFNYFLDVLESGKMTNSLGEEMDLNGFIIIFTSNISKEDFPKRISPELRSRFDYKGMFTVLESQDKQKYLEFRAKSIIRKIALGKTEELESNLLDFFHKRIDVNKYHNMRDLNKDIKKIFVEFLSKSDLEK